MPRQVHAVPIAANRMNDSCVIDRHGQDKKSDADSNDSAAKTDGSAKCDTPN